MHITVNGQPRELPEGTTVSALIQLFNLTPDKVAVEHNRRLLKTERYDTPLSEGDTVELVTFVGGG
jgi:thiamine biosynthesis protein ThiS